MPKAKAIRILVVDDHHVVRSGLAASLGLEEDMIVVAEAGGADECVAQFRQHQPAIVLMDLRLPGANGIAATAELRTKWPDARVLMFTTFDSEEDIYRAMQAGARGYLLVRAPRRCSRPSVPWRPVNATWRRPWPPFGRARRHNRRPANARARSPGSSPVAKPTRKSPPRWASRRKPSSAMPATSSSRWVSRTGPEHIRIPARTYTTRIGMSFAANPNSKPAAKSRRRSPCAISICAQK